MHHPMSTLNSSNQTHPQCCMTNRCMLVWINTSLNANMLMVDPPGDFCVHRGTFTFNEVWAAFLVLVTIIPSCCDWRLTHSAQNVLNLRSAVGQRGQVDWLWIRRMPFRQVGTTSKNKTHWSHSSDGSLPCKLGCMCTTHVKTLQSLLYFNMWVFIFYRWACISIFTMPLWCFIRPLILWEVWLINACCTHHSVHRLFIYCRTVL